MIMKKIWIIYNDDDEAVTAPTWGAAIRAWADRWHITGKSLVDWDDVTHRYATLRERCGEDWQETLTAWDDSVFNDMYDGDYYAGQVPYYDE